MVTERDQNYVLGYRYAEMRRHEGAWVTVAVQKEFGRFYADECVARGLSQSEAWKEFKDDRDED
ncbi:hypothetical protein [Mycobacterium sp. SMC-15]|uniref:hypothetical protein n=1 Tax=Mycobacterium sp. SMC-15 TaxID=3381627 RepID=UPI0038769D13